MDIPSGEDSSTCSVWQWGNSGTTEDSGGCCPTNTPLWLLVNTSLPLSLLRTWSFLAGCRLWRAGGGGRGRGQFLRAVAHPASNNSPLKDAGVFPTHGEDVGVTMGEADIGDVAAVAVVLVARCLERGERNSPLFMTTITRKRGFKRENRKKSVGHVAWSLMIEWGCIYNGRRSRRNKVDLKCLW